MKVLGVVGWKDSGKTTLTIKLVEELSRRGYAVATLKHSHSSRQMDVEGTDTFRHAQAGARTVTLVGDDGWSQVRHGEPVNIDTLPLLCEGADFVVAEGFKRSPWSKIACVPDDDLSILGAASNVVALAHGTVRPNVELSSFSRDDPASILDYWLER